MRDYSSCDVVVILLVMFVWCSYAVPFVVYVIAIAHSFGDVDRIPQSLLWPPRSKRSYAYVLRLRPMEDVTTERRST